MTYTVREFTAGDRETVSGWWSARHMGAFPFALLPPVGIVVEDDHGPACACWLYMAVNIGVGWMEHAISRPKLGLRASREAFKMAVETLEAIGRANDYNYFVCHTHPSVARVLRGFGYLEDPRPKKSVVKLLNQHG